MMSATAGAVALMSATIAPPHLSTSFSHSDDEWHKLCPVIKTETKLDGANTSPIKLVPPQYPTEHHFIAEDELRLIARIDRTGAVFDVRVERASVPEFIDGSLKAVRAWRYAPPTLRGRPSCLETRVFIDYRLDPCDPKKPVDRCKSFHPSYPGATRPSGR